MNFIAYDAITLKILAVGISIASVLRHARLQVDPDVNVNSVLASEALAAAVAVGPVTYWGFTADGVACLPSEVGRAA